MLNCQQWTNSYNYALLPFNCAYSPSKFSPPFWPEWPKRLEMLRLWIGSLRHRHILNLRRLSSNLTLYVCKLVRDVLHMRVKHGIHMLYPSNKAIKMIRSLCLCLRGWLSKNFWCWGESVNLLLSISTLFLNMIPWYLWDAGLGSGDVCFASSRCVNTNGIVSLYYGETTQKFEPCLCNEAYDESEEWHDSSGVPFYNALGQEMEDVSANVSLFMCEKII